MAIGEWVNNIFGRDEKKKEPLLDPDQETKAKIEPVIEEIVSDYKRLEKKDSIQFTIRGLFWIAKIPFREPNIQYVNREVSKRRIAHCESALDSIEASISEVPYSLLEYSKKFSDGSLIEMLENKFSFSYTELQAFFPQALLIRDKGRIGPCERAYQIFEDRFVAQQNVDERIVSESFKNMGMNEAETAEYVARFFANPLRPKTIQ